MPIAGRALRSLLALALLGVLMASPAGTARAQVPDARWELVQNGPQPDRALHGMVFDPASDSLWSFGGVEADAQGNDFHNSVWRFDLSHPDPRWTLVPISGLKPPPLIFFTAVYDPPRRRMIVYGGQIDRSGMGQSLSDGNNVWLLDLSDPEDPSWSRESVAGIQGDRFAHAATYVPGLDAMIVSGGLDAAQRPVNSHYALLLGESPLRWQRLANAGFLPRAAHALVYDAAHQRLLAYGGLTDLNDARTVRNLDALDLSAGLDGADRWTRLGTANAGLSRAFTAHFLDSERGLWWIHGGVEANNRFSRRLSALDLSGPEPTWVETSLVRDGPLERFGHVAAWDPARSMAWFQGGTPDNNRTLADTRALVFEGVATPSPTPSATSTRAISPTATRQATADPTTAVPTTPPPSPTPSATPSPSATPTRDEVEPSSIFLPLTLRSIAIRPEAPTPTTPPSATPTLASTAPPPPVEADFELLGQLGGEASAVAVVGDRAYLGVGPRVEILDLSDPSGPALVGRTPVLPGIVSDLLPDGDRLFVGHDAGLSVVEIQDERAPVVLRDEPGHGAVRALALSEGRLFLAAGSSLRVVDRALPGALLSEVAVGRRAHSVEVEGGRAYVGYANGLLVADVSDPAAARELGRIELGGAGLGLALRGDIAYVASDRDGLWLIDVSDPAAPAERLRFETGGRPQAVALAGDRAYLADRTAGLTLLDLGDPELPTLLGQLATPAFSALDLAVQGARAYVSDGRGGLVVVDVADPASPSLASTHAVLGRGTDLAVGDGIAFGIQYLRGLLVAGLDTPGDPLELVLLGDLARAEDVVVEGDRLHVAAGSAGLVLLDASQPEAPVELSRSGTGGQATSLAVGGGRAYVGHQANGLRVLDLSDPSAPAELGSLELPGMAMDLELAGELLLVAAYDAGLRVLDVSDPATPTELGAFEDVERVYAVAVEGRRAYLAADAEGLVVLDLSDPTDPVELARHSGAGAAYAVLAGGNLAYLAGSRGLERVDLSDPSAPRRIGAPVALPGRQFGLALEGDRVHLAGDAGLLVGRFNP